ncbi:Glutamyl-tRNA(Gln) amidotransferase subunit B-1, chloroplastic/mitochondrial [Trebouxia sp. C0009 RCD-2024]
MTSAILTGTPNILCVSTRTAAVASYTRTLSRLRNTFGTSCSLTRARSLRETALIRCTSTAAVAPPQASEHQPRQANKFEAVIGIETHVQLKTHTKAFCNCKSLYGDEPNTHVCPVCLGHPGTLPVLSKEVVRQAVLAGLALQCQIAPQSKFDRKQYFYPDLPKGYQISQYDVPLCTAGHLEVQVGKQTKTFGITRAHLEEDAGKLNHSGSDQLSGSAYSLVDYNRAGQALLEIVSEPDMRSGQDAAAYGAELRRIMVFLGVSDGEMSEGSMRCDVNVSVRPLGQQQLGTKVEVKNMNSFSAMQKAIDFEIERQVTLIEAGSGEEVVQETRLWDEGKQATQSMRKKEGLADYRYFPEPDLPPLEVSTSYLQDVQASMPQLPAEFRRQYRELGLPAADVLVLADELPTAQYFDDVLAAGAPAKPAANWIMGDIMAFCKESKIDMSKLQLTAPQLAEMVSLIEDGTISGKIAKQILPDLLQGKGSKGVKKFVDQKGLIQVSDPAQIEAIIDTVLAANQKQLKQYRAGKTKLQGHFVGQVMKESKGRVNPALMNKILMQKLNAK